MNISVSGTCMLATTYPGGLGALLLSLAWYFISGLATLLGLALIILWYWRAKIGEYDYLCGLLAAMCGVALLILVFEVILFSTDVESTRDPAFLREGLIEVIPRVVLNILFLAISFLLSKLPKSKK